MCYVLLLEIVNGKLGVETLAETPRAMINVMIISRTDNITAWADHLNLKTGLFLIQRH